MAGINAHRKTKELEPLILKRSDAYIGVLIDDLVNKGTQEPYRMFTSRAEYRILLRQDNADLRLTEIGHKHGLASDTRYQAVVNKRDAIKKLTQELHAMRIEPASANELLGSLDSSPISEKTPAVNLLRRPDISIKDLGNMNTSIAATLDQYSSEVLEQAEINVKYDSYIDREQKLAEKIGSLEDFKIFPDFDYDKVKALSSEAREKLKKIRPATIGQMSRISGVSPADVSVLTVYLGK
jgi:tRNA uridine 5-carboxymethylaminomethyl modification enzyme